LPAFVDCFYLLYFEENYLEEKGKYFKNMAKYPCPNILEAIAVFPFYHR
jgi:hypothetical protein